MYRNTNNKNYVKDDDYETPIEAWRYIDKFIPKDKKIVDPFYCRGKSGVDMRSLGWDASNQDRDFFTLEREDLGDLVITNPAFSIKKEVLQRLIDFNVPFIMIVPWATIYAQYYKKIIDGKDMKYIIPPKRIQFFKNGVQTKGCAFDCIYICHKIDLPQQMNFL